MGTWSPDIIGGDGPMDTLGVLEDILHYDGLYPLRFTPDEIQTVRGLLEEYRSVLVTAALDPEDYPVLAAVYLATGAELPPEITQAAVAACQAELTQLRDDGGDWSDPQARILVLERHVALIQAHQLGVCQNIEHQGLFEKIGAALG